MPTDLLELPGYPGHDQAQPFAQGCVRGITEDTLADAAALQTELSRRVAQLSENQVASLTALSPQTRKLRLRIFLNRVSAHVYNQWTADERPVGVYPNPLIWTHRPYFRAVPSR